MGKEPRGLQDACIEQTKKCIEMMKSCWNSLSKKTEDWSEIQVTMEDQLRVHQNWNLHLMIPIPDMMGLKEKKNTTEDTLSR